MFIFLCIFNSEIQGRNTSPLVQLTYTITLKKIVQKPQILICENEQQEHFIGKLVLEVTLACNIKSLRQRKAISTLKA